MQKSLHRNLLKHHSLSRSQINTNPDRDLKIIYDLLASCATNFIKLPHCYDHFFDDFIIGDSAKGK